MRLTTFRHRHRPRPRGIRPAPVIFSVEPPPPAAAVQDPVMSTGVVVFPR